MNAGLRSDISYVKGINNLKVGAAYEQTFLDEHDPLGIVDPTLNAPLCGLFRCPESICSCARIHQSVTVHWSQSTQYGLEPQCAQLLSVPQLQSHSAALRLDSRRGLYTFNGHTDVKELALYVQDTITKGSWAFNLGLRGDFYNGLTTHKQAEPRLGIAYNIKKTNTILRVSYARLLETPFNENLVLSNNGCANPVLNPLLGCTVSGVTPFVPGWRNEFHAGLQQAFGKYVVFSGEYIWKYTHNAYDFSVFGNTPITFPIEWERSKIPGYAGRVSVPNYHGVSALAVFSGVAARFFTPQIGGAGAVLAVAIGAAASTPFRIDHDEKFNLTTHLQYQLGKSGARLGFNWRYDSGLVAGQTPCLGGNCAQTTTLNGRPAIAMTDSFGTPLTADQEFESGLFCGAQRATPFTPLPNPCLVSQFGSTLLNVPAPNTENDDKNPPRIASRNLFDLAVGDDNLFRGERFKWSLK
jgi:hypothetical protein